MAKSKGEEYGTLDWIMDHSEEGVYLVTANEKKQREIVEHYRNDKVDIYDYREHFGGYLFGDLKEWIDSGSIFQNIFIVNFQLALQDRQDLKRLNFSRDMLAGLRKNLIFFTTPYGDTKLVNGAYDFYSFIKIRVVCEEEEKNFTEKLSALDKAYIVKEETLYGADARQQLRWTYDMVKRALAAYKNGEYLESERLLVQAEAVRKRILGDEHLETMAVCHELARVNKELGNYKRAEELCKKAIEVRKEVLGKEHPDTAESYRVLADVYMRQERYEEAKRLVTAMQ